jgi:ABC-type lipoprotein release transport system permease subunit
MNKGAVMTGAAARQLFPDAAPPKLFVVRYTPGADRAAAFASLERDFPGLVVGFGTADEIRNLQRVDGLAFLLAALLVVLGGGVTAHALVTTTRRRRRDLAVLKTLGFVRRQVTATVAWQATTLAVIGLLLGLPLGVAAGHWSWTFVVGQMGSRSNAVVPILNIAEVLVLILALVNLLAGWPGWKAANLRPATVLRTE